MICFARNRNSLIFQLFLIHEIRWCGSSTWRLFLDIFSLLHHHQKLLMMQCQKLVLAAFFLPTFELLWLLALLKNEKKMGSKEEADTRFSIAKGITLACSISQTSMIKFKFKRISLKWRQRQVNEAKNSLLKFPHSENSQFSKVHSD